MALRGGLCACCATATSHSQVLGDQMCFGLELDLFIHSIIQQLFSASLPNTRHRAMAQKTKMTNIQWLTNSDIYRSEIKN